VQGLYAGIDAVFYLDNGRPRYDLVVAAGADPASIRMKIEGATKVDVAANGTLRIATTLGTVEQRELFAYQEFNGRKQKVACAFTFGADGHVILSTGRYDRSRPLVIDPLVYSTYLGGSGDENVGYWITAGSPGPGRIAADASGNAYITGSTLSTNFPRLNAAQSSNYSGVQTVFVTKLTSSGALSYSTYLGGGDDGYYYRGEEGLGIAADGAGNAYVTGYTRSLSFPTLNAMQSSTPAGGSDGFVTKLTSSGTLSYSTYLGGSLGDKGCAIAVDGSGSVYVAGFTSSLDFPSATGSSTHQGFLAKIASSGELTFSRYLSGQAHGVAFDGSGNIYVTGPTPNDNSGVAQDIFAMKYTSSGSVSYSVTFGGSVNDVATGIGVDGSGNAYITGWTESTNFPMQNALQSSYGGDYDVFITKLTSTGSISYSTYLGTSSQEFGFGIAVDGGGNAFVTGVAGPNSASLTTSDAVQQSAAGASEAFVVRLNPSGVKAYFTLLGGSGHDNARGIAIDGSGHAYITGYTGSTNFPTSNAAQGSKAGGDDAFVAKILMSSITSASLSGSSPYCSGASVTVSWTSSGVSSVNIEFSTDNGTNWTSVATGQTSGSTGGSYAWTIPNSAGSNRRVRVSVASNSAVNATSSAFTINTAPSVTSDPGSNDPVCPGTSVTFSAAGSGTPTPDVQWQISTDDGDTFTDIDGETSTSLAISSPTLAMDGYQYRALFTNSCSSTPTAAATLHIEDNSAPVPDEEELSDVTGECSVTISTAPTATDGCVGTVTGTTSDDLSYSEQGIYTIHWTYDDGNGNTSTQEQRVIVDDVTAPVPDDETLPDVTGECSVTITSTPTATDNCAGTVEGTTNDPLSYTAQGTYTIHWTYEDGNGNTTTQEQRVIVDDVTVPTLSVSLAPVSLWPPNRTMQTIGITASTSDNCGSASWVLASISGNDGTTSSDMSYTANTAPGSVQVRAERSGLGNGRTYTLTFTASDGHGNEATVLRYVYVPRFPGKVVTGASSEIVQHGFNSAVVPNPFTSATEIRFSVPGDGMVTILIYDQLGNEMVTLMHDELKAGAHEVTWSGLRTSGERAAAGEYFYRIEAQGTSETGQITLVR
jgi:hypothetical protein